MNLAEASLPYRRLELYDKLHHDADHTAARQQQTLIDQYRPDARTVLDVGCGTGGDLAYHASRFTCTGIDIQPQMIAYARKRHPDLDLHVGDMRTIRLGRTFDVILSVGLTPSYMLDDADLAAALATFAVHAHTGTLLILQTLDQVPEPRRHTFRVDTPAAPAEVTVEYATSADSQTVIMNRAWHLDDGTVAHDHIARRVLTPAILHSYLAGVGFTAIQTEGHQFVLAGRHTARTRTSQCDQLIAIPGQAPNLAGRPKRQPVTVRLSTCPTFSPAFSNRSRSSSRSAAVTAEPAR